MLRLAVVTPNPLAADAIELLAQESGAFQVCYKASPVPPAKEVVRMLSVQNPALVLLDLGDWAEASRLTQEIQHNQPRAVIVGFRPRWNRSEQLTFEDAGILDLLHEPFSPGDIEAGTYEAMHRRYPVTHQNILAFMPAKAGSGCSTATLHLAAAIAATDKKVLLIECDRRSGPLSIMLNLERHSGLPEALEHHGEMSPLEWRQVTAQLAQMDLLLANPTRGSRLPSWADYYQLLLFAQKQYDCIVVDLPEVINQATAEFVRNARAVFVVCQPEMPSVKLAKFRRTELESCEIPADRVKILLNRWERGRLTIENIEKIVEGPVFGTLPNDYKEIRNAVLETRLAAPSSSFNKACQTLARTVSSLAEVPRTSPKFTLLRKLGATNP
ncbi:MAG: Flp pilus assembly protein ATPase CpaE-like protein [Bryobacterales bacterium]|nr:Flp pilus assembly protein ATPase CpaE-like protein [Bryobacterales bacterium]